MPRRPSNIIGKINEVMNGFYEGGGRFPAASPEEIKAKGLQIMQTGGDGGGIWFHFCFKCD